MSSLFQDLTTGLDEIDTWLANNPRAETPAPSQVTLLSFRSAAEESASHFSRRVAAAFRTLKKQLAR
jgi:hypothetical protein